MTLDGHLLVDAHVHVPVLGSLAPAWLAWARDFGPDGILEDVWDADGVPRPDRLDALFAEQGVDHALLFCEYSPKATGYQRFDDLLPIVEQNPTRFRPVANVNPHLHFPIAEEVRRQLDLGAAALKLHPVHGGFRCDDAMLYPAYQVLAERGVPAGRALRHEHLPRLDERARRPGVPAAGGAGLPDPRRRARARRPRLVVRRGRRSWRCRHPTVWIELSGLPPKRLPEYYRNYDLARLARRWIFATDWPGVPGTAQNARAVAGLGLDESTVAAVLGGNAAARLRRPRPPARAAETPRRRDAMTEVPTGRPAAELSDEELETQGKQLHDSRNWVFLHGSAAQFDTHTARMLELEQEYLRRFPKRTWQGVEGEAPVVATDDPVLALLRAGGRRARRPDAQARGAPDRPGRRARARRAGPALHRRAAAARHREAGPGDHRGRPRPARRGRV